MGCLKIWAVVAAVMVAAVATKGTEGQSTVSCAQKLVPCANYINSTNPPTSCCNPLRDTVTNELSCLCNLYNTPGLLDSLNLNITQALLLASRCNISADLNSCLKASAPSSIFGLTPPVTPGKDSNGVGRITWTRMSTILLFLTSMMLY
ncbi:hypothetical protein Vadar_032306 [Vaccinium darrowii]|uniref:Uncharacterized protein n=1 Tax=Vaccinium darrowii TaxID=229202 RepID=A0ACB7X5W2_9ERIC|nr:hypothetical protein Vadar_032306 [Vaccinium darrowii]